MVTAMREILFRGKTTENRWVEGVYFKHDTVKVCFSSDDPKPRHLIIQDGFCDWGFEPPIHCVDVNPGTVGQYTGRKDKNGKKVFEHDILQLYTIWADGTVEKGAKVVVQWSDNDQCYVLTIKDGLPCDDFGNLGKPEYYKVIGNIHDNPELLGGEG